MKIGEHFSIPDSRKWLRADHMWRCTVCVQYILMEVSQHLVAHKRREAVFLSHRYSIFVYQYEAMREFNNNNTNNN